MSYWFQRELAYNIYLLTDDNIFRGALTQQNILERVVQMNKRFVVFVLQLYVIMLVHQIKIKIITIILFPVYCGAPTTISGPHVRRNRSTEHIQRQRLSHHWSLRTTGGRLRLWRSNAEDDHSYSASQRHPCQGEGRSCSHTGECIKGNVLLLMFR